MENEVKTKKKFLNKKVLIITGVVILLGLIVGLNIYRSHQKAGMQVTTTKVKETRMVETVLSSGKVNSSQKEVIFSQVNGSVKKIHVKLGQQVKAGQLLMELDIPDAASKVMQAQSALDDAQARLIKARAGGKSTELIESEASYNRAKSEYEVAKEKLLRNQSLYSSGVISKADMEAVQADYNSRETEYHRAEAILASSKAGSSSSLKALESSVAAAQASLDLAKKQAGQSGLCSTIDGRVMSIPVQVGDMVSINTVLADIGNLDALQVKADIAEVDAAKIKTGQKVKITSSAIADVNFRGQVKEIGLEAQTKTKNSGETTSIPVIISIAKNSLLRPGYNVDLELTTAVYNKALVVPFDALIEKQGHSCVYIERAGKAHLQRVVTGSSNSQSIQIKSGLKKGDKVIVSPPQKLKDGSEVKVK